MDRKEIISKMTFLYDMKSVWHTPWGDDPMEDLLGEIAINCEKSDCFELIDDCLYINGDYFASLA